MNWRAENPQIEAWWQGVLGRDHALDGRFVFAVTTTGVYCRPSCSARHPLRRNARFFAAPDEAELAGFRPCKRCQPRGEQDETQATMREIRHYIETHLDGDVSLDALGAEFALSPFHLQRTFKRVVGVTPRQYAEALRRDAVKQGLRDGKGVTEAMHAAGYQSASSFYQDVRGKLGMRPSAYRKGGEGMTIAYGLASSPLGTLLVAATNDGVCALSFSADEAAALASLEAEYPRATIRRDDAAVAPWVSSVLAYLTTDGEDGASRREAAHDLTDLPLDIPTSPFRGAVYERIRAIPSGTKQSYGMIARAIGQPKAARAVAQACAHNPAALVIPCHRVVHENGDDSGYRWGTERKRRLLAIEAARGD